MLRNRQKISRTLPIATIFLMIAIVWPKLIHSPSNLGHNGEDIVRGAIFGLAIGMLLMTGIYMRHQRRLGQKRKMKNSDDSQK
jgi:hypothetical protein